MLPPELTRARKREGKLTLSPLSAPERTRATEVSEALLAVTRAGLGCDREEVEAGWAAVPVAAKERKLLLGLTHLVEARSDFSTPAGADPEVLRRSVFTHATQMRAALGPGEYLNREAVLAKAAEELGISAEIIDDALYADLRGAQRLQSAPVHNAAALVVDYELTQVQSVLLRAVRIEAEVRAARPDAYRELFRKLKFRQLLFRIEPLAGGGYRLEIDGPMSLFGATTKYGLELALSLPALLSCGQLRLKADLRWGKRREKLSFEQTYAEVPNADEHNGVRSEVAELLDALQGNASWQACLSDKLIDLTTQGGGVLVPDLELTRAGDAGKPSKRGAAAAASKPAVLVELLGFWSRDAVFRRIEAAKNSAQQAGRIPMLFVASSRLRVSEELLDGVEAASLYVYKGKINAAALLRKAEALL